MKDPDAKKFYFPGLIILAVVVSLLVLISISTYRNLYHQRKTIHEMVFKQGRVLLNAAEAVAKGGKDNRDWGADTVTKFLAGLAENDDISYLYITNLSGRIIFHSSPGRIKEQKVWSVKLESMAQIKSRRVSAKDGLEIFEAAKLIDYYGEGQFVSKGIASTDNQLSRKIPHRGTIVAGIKMNALADAQKEDVQHAIVMAVIIIALGTSTIYFIFVIHKYLQLNRVLKQTQEYMDQVFASLANGLISIDPSGQVISYNEKALKLLDISKHDIDGLNLENVLDFYETGISDTLSNRRANLEREVTYETKNDRQLPLAVSVTPICQEDQSSLGAVIMLRDLTEIKMLESQMRRAEKMAAVGELSASVAHEIRNPLSSIKGFARYLHDKAKEGANEREFTQIIIQEVERINTVINDLLTFARPVALEQTPLDILELVDHVVRLVQPDADNKNITIVQKFVDQYGPVSIDRNQFTQAVLNLLLNAIAAVEPNGFITVGVEAYKARNYFSVWVQDNGPGIAPELHTSIFDPFFTTRKNGTGLGLAIVRKIVEDHRGQVLIESPYPGGNRGCRFTIRIPLLVT